MRLDLTGDWTGQLPITTEPPADWSSARVAFVQSRELLTGELVSRDGRRFTLNGNVLPGALPTLRVGGLSPTSIICGVVLSVTEFEFINGQVGQLSGRAGGRCPGTIGGSFILKR